MENVKELINEIKTGLSQISSSIKDEERVMRAMLNDKNYSVGIYGKEGKLGDYCPAQEARHMAANIIAGTTRISRSEAEALAAEYEFGKSDSAVMIGIAKEFTNTYLQTGRKLSFGGRENSEIAISQKQVEATTKRYPKRIGTDENGQPIYDENAIATIPAYGSAKIWASCPSWVK